MIKVKGKKTGGIENQRNNQDNPDHSSVEIRYDTWKSPGDLRKLVVNSDFSEKKKTVKTNEKNLQRAI